MHYPKEIKENILSLKSSGFSGRAIAKTLGLSKSGVNEFLNRTKQTPHEVLEEIEVENMYEQWKKSKKPKVLFFDIETSASIALIFSRFKAFTSPSAVIQEPYMLTFCAKWADNNNVMAHSLHHYESFEKDVTNDFELVNELWKLLDKADIVIAHNAPFDLGWFNQRCVVHGFVPPSPYKMIDTLKSLKKTFKLPSNSLDASTKYFDVERKLDNEGISLWRDCMNGDEEAFERMLEYNIGDVYALEGLFNTISAWVPNLPNMSLYYRDSVSRCTGCGSNQLEKTENKAYTALSEFDSYRCLCCGRFNRSRRANTRSFLSKIS